MNVSFAFSPWFYGYKICSSSNIRTYEIIKIFPTKCLVFYWCRTILWVLSCCLAQNFLLSQTHLELFLKTLSPQHNPQGLILPPITTPTEDFYTLFDLYPYVITTYYYSSCWYSFLISKKEVSDFATLLFPAGENGSLSIRNLWKHWFYYSFEISIKN